MIDPETMPKTPAGKAVPVPQPPTSMEGQQSVEPTSVDTVLGDSIPAVPTFTSIRIQSVGQYEDEQQILASEKVGEESSSVLLFPEMDQEATQDPALAYSAP